MTPIDEMARVREWAKERLASGAEPPWSYYRLMQVIDAIDALTSNAPTPDGTTEEMKPRATLKLVQR